MGTRDSKTHRQFKASYLRVLGVALLAILLMNLALGAGAAPSGQREPLSPDATHYDSFGLYGAADNEFHLPQGGHTASVVSYEEDFTQGTGWTTSGCAVGQGLWKKTAVPPLTIAGQVTPPFYWYGNQPALDFKPDLPPKAGPCPALDPPCYRCINTGDFKPEYATGDLCAFGGGQHCGNLTSPRISLFNVPPPIKLTFKNCLEKATKAYNIARLEMAVNGGEFFTVKTFATNQSCTTTEIDLADYSGAIVQFRWFMAVIGISSYATNAYGWVVDDVKVTGGFDTTTQNRNPEQRVYVADTGNHRINIWKYKTDAAAVTQFAPSKNFGVYGTGNGDFNSPEDVVVAPNGYIYVADTGNHRLQVFDKDGNHRANYGSYGTANGEFNSPGGVATSGWVLKTGAEPGRVADYFYLYVADTLNHRVQRFKIQKNAPTTLTHDGNTGSYGTADGKFDLPAGIGMDPIDTPSFGTPPMFQLPTTPEQWKAHFYVADSLNHRIQYFDLTGTYTNKWGQYGDGNSEFDAPQDVAVGIRLSGASASADRLVDVYVADTGNHQIKHYSDTGAQRQTPVGKYGTADGEFDSPNGIAVDRKFQQITLADYPKSLGTEGDFFVIDTLNHRGQRMKRQ